MKRWQEFEAAVDELLTRKRWSFWTFKNYRCWKCGAVGNAKGRAFPDFLVYYPVALAIECKVGSGRLRNDQKEARDKMILSGIAHIELRDNLDELIEFIERYEREIQNAKKAHDQAHKVAETLRFRLAEKRTEIPGETKRPGGDQGKEI